MHGVPPGGAGGGGAGGDGAGDGAGLMHLVQFGPGLNVALYFGGQGLHAIRKTVLFRVFPMFVPSLSW